MIEKEKVEGSEGQKDVKLVRVELDDALKFASTMTIEDFISRVRKMQFIMEDLPKVIQFFDSLDEEKVMLGVIGLRRLLSIQIDPPI